MPFASLSTVLALLDGFITHWTSVNGALGATPLVLKGTYNLASLQADRASLATLYAAVQTADNTRQIATSDRQAKLLALKERLRQFRATVQGQLGNTPYINALPTQPNRSTVSGAYMNAFDDMLNLWTQINAATIPGFTGPLKLSGGYLIATFTTDYTALKTAFTTLSAATNNAKLARESRNDALDPVFTRLKEYRKAVQGAFPAGNALLAALPALTPPAGSTPNPVVANGLWNVATSRAEFTHTKSDSKRFARYEYRFTAGKRYSSTDFTVLGSIPDINTLTFDTTTGLSVSGEQIAAKCYVITLDGNERGSNTVVITRP